MSQKKAEIFFSVFPEGRIKKNNGVKLQGGRFWLNSSMIESVTSRDSTLSFIIWNEMENNLLAIF